MKKDFDSSKILNSVALGIFTVDMDWNIKYFNDEAEKITGFTKKEALGRKCYEIFRTELCHKGCYLRIAMETGSKIVKVRNRILNRKNKEIPVDITVSILQDGEGKIIGGVESFQDDSVRVILEKEIHGLYSFGDIIGKDERIVRIFDLLSTVARTNAPVLLLGETGTGKDIFARAVHNASTRRDGPFIKVNCAALPSQLLESELFGYKKGAFTDAKRDKLGRFQMAEGGTIFLDEIGELSHDLQAKLLQVLDEKEFYPLGSTRPVRVNVRVIASTNRKLSNMTLEKAFRQDLYYRLRVVEVEIPPLRERSADVPLLVDHFLAEQARIMGKEIKGVTSDFMGVLLNYPYPGNVRELRNIIEHAMILHRGDKMDKDLLPLYLFEKKDSFPLPSSYDIDIGTKQQLSYKEKEKEKILKALRTHGWRRSATSMDLRMNRTTLWRKMKKYNLQNTN
ncbi:MAG TPA: sigma 54-interacting transcriptional regulator [Syntrophales bacterium]|nr:sigma 54-interacting transcriptional regulator [Syntrophales bacterium]